MATADIEKLAVFDDRVVQSRPKYAVVKGGASINAQNVAANTNSASQLGFNVVVPDLNTFVDRAIDWRAQCYLQFTLAVAGAVPPLNTPLVLPGVDFALAPFPLHQLTSSMQVQINSQTVSIATNQMLNELLRMVDMKKNRMQRTCPTYLDTYASYNDAFGASNNPLGDYADSPSRDDVPNGAYWDLVFTDNVGNPLGTNAPAFGGATYNSVDGIPVSNGVAAGPHTIYIRFGSTEKLVLPPFVFSDIAEYQTGIFGVTAMVFTMNMVSPSQTSSSGGRVLRTTTANGRTISAVAYNSSVSGSSPFAGPTLTPKFINPSIELDLPLKSVVPLTNFQTQVQSFTQTIAGGSSSPANSINGSSYTLTQIPDYFVIYAKPSSYAATDADWYLPINQINITLANQTGLLSTMTQEDLYSMSVKNGLDMDYQQYRGRAKVASATGAQVGLTGGFLIIKPGVDFPLPVGIASGVVGNFSFQVQASVYNPSSTTVTAFQFYVLAVSSGFLETIKGTSQQIGAPLREEDVIDAPLAPAATRVGLRRMVGAGFFDSLATGIMKLRDIHSKAAPIVRALKPHLPQGAQKVLSAVGMGKGKKMLADRLM